MTLHTTTARWTLSAVIVLLASAALADDWPTYRHDNRRSGVTGETLAVPLKAAWTRASADLPQPAWQGPAQWDAYASIKGLASMRDFDPVFFVTVVGGKVYFGSSVDDSATCLDAATGKEVWSFVTGGAVRLPPTLSAGKAYFGSDDGAAYCVDAGTGEELWRVAPAKDVRKIPCNGKLISLWPVRTGVLLADGKAYFGASLLPWRSSYLYAADAATGKTTGEGLYSVTLKSMTLQGAMLSTGDRLLAMQGRLGPMMFARAGGQALGTFDKQGRIGGIYAVLTEDDKVIYGHGTKKPELFGHNAANRAQMFKFPNATRIVVTPQTTYMARGNELVAENLIAQAAGPQEVRKLYSRYVQLKAAARSAPAGPDKVKADAAAAAGKAALRAAKDAGKGGSSWKITFPVVHDMILAGETLVVGTDDKVVVFDAAAGKELWSAAVSGKAQGLAVADGRLYVSTSDGSITCFEK